MPDATGGVASGVYWVITGRMPTDELEDDDLKAKPEDDEEDPKKKP